MIRMIKKPLEIIFQGNKIFIEIIDIGDKLNFVLSFRFFILYLNSF